MPNPSEDFVDIYTTAAESLRRLTARALDAISSDYGEIAPLEVHGETVTGAPITGAQLTETLINEPHVPWTPPRPPTPAADALGRHLRQLRHPGVQASQAFIDRFVTQFEAHRAHIAAANATSILHPPTRPSPETAMPAQVEALPPPSPTTLARLADTTPKITAPWIDPLLMYNVLVRFVIAPEARDCQLIACFGSTPLYLGSSPEQWRGPGADPTLNIVSYALYYPADGTPPYWYAISFTDLPRWIKQIEDETHIDITLGVTPQTITFIKRLPVSERDLFRALRHPLCTPATLARVPQNQLYLESTAGIRMALLTRLDIEEQRSDYRRIHAHAFRPNQTFFVKGAQVTHNPRNRLFCGIEMEMELPRDRHEAREALFLAADSMPRSATADRAQERLHIEEDGSVARNGFECVLMPHEIGSLQSELFWRKMWETACLYGSNRERSAGMHIHASGAAALAPVIGQTAVDSNAQASVIGYCIDVITGILAGGTQFQPFGSVRPISVAFGRPERWASSGAQDFARVDFNFQRKNTGMRWLNRYRHVNWNNRNTLEFRLFGPMDYNIGLCKDWLNVATQLVAGIIAFARKTALDVLCQRGHLHAQQYLDSLPPWFVNRLRAPLTVGTRAGLYAGINGSLFAIENQNHAWLPGISLTMEGRGSAASLSAACPSTTDRATAWKALIRFLENESPQYDIALQHLKSVILPAVDPLSFEPAY